jgi:hydrogenase 3 maturation protease
MNVLIGIGNILNGDDGIGPWVAQHFRHENWKTIDCGTVPENFTGPVKKWSPDLLVLVDATDMDLPPGEIRCIPTSMISELHLSTHALPLSLLMNHLQGTIKKMVLVGIQPKRFTGPLSREVHNAGKHLITILTQNTISTIQSL